MTLGSICYNGLSGQERWCVVLDSCMLHLELTIGVSGMAHAHGLWVEVVDLEKAAGCLLLKPDLVPSLLHFAWFHQSSSFINLDDSCCNTIDMAYNNCNSDDINWQDYLAINITQTIFLATLNIKSPWGTHKTSPSFRVTHQLHPGPWPKAIPRMGLPLPMTAITQTVFPKVFFICFKGTSSSPTVRNCFVRAGPARMVDPLVLTNQVVFPKCISQCFNIPPPSALNVAFNGLLYHSIFPGAGV